MLNKETCLIASVLLYLVFPPFGYSSYFFPSHFTCPAGPQLRSITAIGEFSSCPNQTHNFMF